MNASKTFKADSPPIGLRLDRKGEVVVRGYFSLDGKSWDLVREQIVEFGKDVRVGVVAVQNTKDGYQAEFDHFAIRVGPD